MHQTALPVCADLEDVIAFYHERIKQYEPARDFLTRRGLSHDLIDTFQLGFADRELGRSIPPKRNGGAEIRKQLNEIGIYRESGHAHFNGSLVVPIRNRDGQVCDIYGRKIGTNLVKGTRFHLYLPNRKERGIFNWPGIRDAKEVIVTDSVLNALTFYSAGITHVTCTLGAESSVQQPMLPLTEEQLEALAGKRIVLAMPNTEAGDELAAKLVRQLKQVSRLKFPPGCDANDVGADKLTQPTPEAQPTANDLVLTFDDRRYRVRGLDNNNSLDRLKVNLLVSRDDLMHVDTFDLYAARARNSFIKQASSEIYVEEDVIKRDLAKLLLKLEAIQEQQVKAKLTIEPKVQLSQREREDALALLSDPNLLDRILEDYDRCGLVGEETNKLICYLACVSRLLPQPLAVMIQSSTAAGKTSLMDAALAFMPEEEVVRYSAMTGQSLYYMKDMQHKILAIAEEDGVSQASYALKLLQSDGKLRIASAGKDDTGRQQTHEYEVKGPVMMFLTTTSEMPDPELQNRCLTLHVNETPEQTAAIHNRQAARYTQAGQEQLAQRKAIIKLHQNAQRLLEPKAVLIPWANQLTFRRDQTRMRRDYEKYLALIASVTLLHQREVATIDDIIVANRLASEALGQSLDDLLPQTRQLLVLWDDLLNVHGRNTFLTQRELRDALGWGDFQLRRHLSRLVELEYVLVHRTGRGNGRAYELLYDGQGRDGERFLLGLIDPAQLT